jgi:hypothetical protein
MHRAVREVVGIGFTQHDVGSGRRVSNDEGNARPDVGHVAPACCRGLRDVESGAT